MPPPSVCCSVGSVHAKERADANEWEAIARSPENLGGEVASGLINEFNQMEKLRTGLSSKSCDRTSHGWKPGWLSSGPS